MNHAQRELKKLTRNVRREPCPPHVLEAVFEQVAAARRSRRPQWLWVGAAVAACAVIAVIGLDRHLPQPPAPTPHAAAQPEAVAAEASASVLIVGQVLRDSGRKTSERLAHSSIPQLLSAFKTVRTALDPTTSNPSSTHES